MRQKSYVENVEKRRSRVIRQRPKSDRETVSNFECRNASRSVRLGRSLAESAVRLSSLVETVDGRQSSLVEFGSVGHVGVRVYTFRKTKSWSPKYLTVSTKFSFPLLSSSDTRSSRDVDKNW